MFYLTYNKIGLLAATGNWEVLLSNTNHWGQLIDVIKMKLLILTISLVRIGITCAKLYMSKGFELRNF